MSQPDQQALEPSRADAQTSPLLRAAIWVAIGALIAAALVCVVWVLIGEQNGIVGRAFLTILLLAGFAGVAILDAHLAPRRPAWFALASMATWIVTLLIGAVMIWMPERYSWSGFGRFLQFLFIVLILQLALLHVRLYMKALERYVTRFTQIVAFTTIGLVALLAILLIIPLMLSEWVDFADIYWRIVVATAILAAVGTALLPLVNALFAPRRPRPVAAAAPAPAPGYPGGPAYGAGFGASAGYGASGGYGPAGGYGAPATPATPAAPAAPAAYPGAQPAPAVPPFSAQLPAAPEPYRGPAGATPVDPTVGTDAAPPAPQAEQPHPARSVVTHAAVQQAQAEAAQAAGEQPAPDAGPSNEAAPSEAAPAEAAPAETTPPRAPAAAPAASAEPELLPWPMFADGVTPLPMMPDGSPDFAAYQTGYPSPGAHVFAPVSPAPVSPAPVSPAPVSPAPVSPAAEAPEHAAPPAPGYDGFPPPPPLPSRG
ncbi:hypothetical protein [Microbacterium aurantiacum]|uniref:hypothetical protein n=1 Tax=Microbacterium aurantiacum TaxID=162393 RepID=UPI003D71DFFD